MSSPFGEGDGGTSSDELLSDLGEGEPDETSDDAGAGGQEPAAR